MVVDHALGVFGRAARVNDVRHVVALRRTAGELRSAFDKRIEACPARRIAADQQVARHPGGLSAHQLDFGANARMRDHRRRAGMIGAEGQIFGAQLLGARNRDGTQPIEREHREQPSRNLRQHDDDAVAFFDTEVA